jgi:hypothetical protein
MMARALLALAALALALFLVAGPPALPPSYAQGVTERGPFGGVILTPRQRRRVPGYYIERPPRVAPRKQLTQHDATVALSARGFHDIAFVRQRGATFIFEATGQRGERVRLVVNSHTGAIDGVRQLSAPTKKR